MSSNIKREDVIAALKKVEDPELMLDIWFLGLIYDITINQEKGEVEIEMTFTSPMCPVGPAIVQDVQEKVKEIEGVKEVKVKVVFDPPWEPPDEVKGLLGLI